MYRFMGIMVTVFATGQIDRGSIPKTQNMVLDAYLLNTQYYKVRFKDKWSNLEKGVVHFLTPLCSCY